MEKLEKSRGEVDSSSMPTNIHKMEESEVDKETLDEIM